MASPQDSKQPAEERDQDRPLDEQELDQVAGGLLASPTPTKTKAPTSTTSPQSFTYDIKENEAV